MSWEDRWESRNACYTDFWEVQIPYDWRVEITFARSLGEFTSLYRTSAYDVSNAQLDRHVANAQFEFRYRKPWWKR